ncbi:MAG: orotidine-5'-phosphate decarboxylase [Victivallales bacterium]|nr:orotidine-5'-phosphate decarboxylase [Victivallales bacterium]
MIDETRLMVALDVPELNLALELVDRLGDQVEWYKVGKQLFTHYGPMVLKELKSCGRKVFLDMKFHDIPNTVAQAIRSAALIGADIINVHASGGPAMLAAAAEAGRETGKTVIAVTVLTSMDAEQLQALGIQATPAEQVLRLARLTQAAGLPGVVCSALELPMLRREFGPNFLTLVPGIRPAGAAAGDQKRIMTPAQAAAAGANYIIVGRPIVAAPDPATAAQAVLAELHSVS